MKALRRGQERQSPKEQSLEPPPPEASPAVRTVEPTPSLLTEVPAGGRTQGQGLTSHKGPSQRPRGAGRTRLAGTPARLPGCPWTSAQPPVPARTPPGPALTAAVSSFLISHLQSRLSQVYSLQLLFLTAKFLLIFTATTLRKELRIHSNGFTPSLLAASLPMPMALQERRIHPGRTRA